MILFLQPDVISISAVTAIFLGIAQHAQPTTHWMQICANVSSVTIDWCLNHCHVKSFLEIYLIYMDFALIIDTSVTRFPLPLEKRKNCHVAPGQHHKKWWWLWRCKECTLSSWWHDNMEIFSPLILLCVIGLDKFVNKVKLPEIEIPRHRFDIMRLDGICLRETDTFSKNY